MVLGKSFLEALTSKYVENLHGRQSQEQVVLGSSQGTIVVEAVGLDKIRRKLANLEGLREVSLDNGNVASADPPGTIRSTCPSELVSCFPPTRANVSPQIYTVSTFLAAYYQIGIQLR